MQELRFFNKTLKKEEKTTIGEVIDDFKSYDFLVDDSGRNQLRKAKITRKNIANQLKYFLTPTTFPLFEIGLVILLFGLIYSRAALSIGMCCLLANALIAQPIKKTFRLLFNNQILLALTSIFFLYLWTGLYSENQAYFWQRIRIQLPFLFLPFCFAKNHFTTPRRRQQFLYFFFVLVAVAALFTTAVIWQRHQTFLLSFSDTVYLPTLINHVRFSLMVAFCTFVGYYLFQQFRFRYRLERYLIAVLTLFLVLFLHLTAVRSGLVGFYAATVGLLIQQASKRRYWWGFLTAVLIGIAAYGCLPSFQSQVQTTCDSVQSLWNGTPIMHESDAGRWQSIQSGIEIAKKNSLFGVGLGDIKTELNLESAQNSHKIILPHNQFVFIMTFGGLFGLVWFGLVW